MALHYNLAKVYEISSNDADFAQQILVLFLDEIPTEIQNIKEGIKAKDYPKTYAAAHKIKPTLDLLGMDQAFEEILQIEAWTKAEGKRKEIDATFDSVESQIEKAVKEISKDFEL